MPVKLFVGGLSFTTSNEGLRGAFAQYGVVNSATVMMDRETGRSRGFGFVEMATTEEADRAIGALNGANLDGRTIRVDKATPRGTGPRPGGPPRGGFGDRRPPAGGPPRGGFGDRRPAGGGGFGERRPAGGGGFGNRPGGGGGGFGETPGGGFGDKSGGKRRAGGWGERSGPGGPRKPGAAGEQRRGKRSGGRPTNERRAGDRGRRSEDDSGRWGR